LPLCDVLLYVNDGWYSLLLYKSYELFCYFDYTKIKDFDMILVKLHYIEYEYFCCQSMVECSRIGNLYMA